LWGDRVGSKTATAIQSDERMTPAQIRMIILASLGGALEFYDFVIYGIFAQSISVAFFPNNNPLISLIQSYAVYAISFLARPLGGMILGALGDRLGRKNIFILSILTISASTSLLGLMPTYAQWGIASTLLIIALRLFQGICLGGELPCSIIYVVETLPKRAGLVCGILIFCVNTGVALGAVVNLVLSLSLSPADFALYGWRIAFLFGGVTGLLSYFLRRSLQESAEFVAMKGAVAKTPFREVTSQHPGELFAGIASTAATAAFNGLFFAYMPAYLTSVLHVDRGTTAIAQNVGLVVTSIVLLGVSWLSDRFSRRAFLMGGAGLMVVFAYPFFQELARSTENVVLLFALAGIAAGMVNGVFAVVLADLFPTRIRFSGVGISYNVSMTLFNGTVPLIAASLVAATGSSLSPALLIIAFASLSFISGLFLPKVSGRILLDHYALAEAEAAAAAD